MSVILFRVARTVIIGGILSASTAEEVHRLAKECGTVCSITYPLPKEELEYNGNNICIFFFQLLSISFSIFMVFSDFSHHIYLTNQC